MMKVRELGVGLDIENKKVYFRFEETDGVLMNVLHSIISRNPGNFEVLAVKEGKDIYSTGLKLDLKAYSSMLSVYMSRRNQRMG